MINIPNIGRKTQILRLEIETIDRQTRLPADPIIMDIVIDNSTSLRLLSIAPTNTVITHRIVTGWRYGDIKIYGTEELGKRQEDINGQNARSKK